MANSGSAEKRGSPKASTDSGWSLHAATIAGIPIRLHFSFLFILAWIAWASPPNSKVSGVLFMLGVFTCVVLHELGHSITAQRYGIGVAEIVLYPIGGIARMEKLPKPRQELWIALAGPAVNVVIAALLYGVIAAAGTLRPQAIERMGQLNILPNLLIANISLAVFNMIPAFPMDGGRVLRALLALKMGEVRATEVAAGIGQMLALAAGFFVLMNYQRLGGNGIMLLFICFFIFVGAGQEAAMYRGKALVEGLPAQAAMVTDFRTLEVGASLRQAADMLLQTSQQDFPVMHGEEVVGVLPRSSLLRGLAESGPDTYVAEIMSREFVTVPRNGDLEAIASEMQAGQTPVVLVMEEGELLGMVTLENLAELLIIRQVSQRSKSADAN